MNLHIALTRKICAQEIMMLVISMRKFLKGFDGNVSAYGSVHFENGNGM
jgi:hypothetical protein